MDGVLAEFAFATAFLDDVIIGGRNLQESFEHVNTVLSKFRNINITVAPSKCQYFADRVEYLGHSICAEGVLPLPTHLEAIQKATSPKNTTELKLFLGLLNYFHRNIPHISSYQRPLTELLKKNVRWDWSDKVQAAFEKLKELVVEAVRVHFFTPSWRWF